MKDADRPYILFERTYNKGLTDRLARINKDGKQERAGLKGEHTIEQRKALVDSRPPFSPYVWATADWVMHQTHPSKGAKIIGYGNFDKLPASYPKEWREQLERIEPIVKPLAQAQEMLKKAQEQIAQLQQQQANGQHEEDTELPRPEKSTRRLSKKSKDALGSTGETTDHATS